MRNLLLTCSNLRVEVNFKSRRKNVKIGEVARQAGIQASAVRYYERIGLLPPAHRVSGRRLYEPSVLDQLALIQVGVKLGFTLEELRELLRSMDYKTLPAAARKLAERKIGELDRLIDGATRIRRLLNEALQCGCLELESCVLVRGARQLPPETWVPLNSRRLRRQTQASKNNPSRR
jgi:MerR family redox-sensitive transcriptional activator SoxR